MSEFWTWTIDIHPDIFQIATLSASAFYLIRYQQSGRRADFWVSAIESFRKLVPQAGVLSSEEINSWADARLKESENGTFFGASNFYSYIVRRK